MNTKRGLLSAPTQLNAAPRTDGSAVVEGFAALGQTFAGLSDRIGRLADKAAAKEGAEAGRAAGLDPEFRTVKNNTIRGDAFDAAGLDVHKTKVALTLESEMAAAFDAHKGDGAALAKALDAKRSFVAGALPEIRPDLELDFTKRRLHYMREAARLAASRADADARAALEDETGRAMRALEQRAYGLGLDASADDVLADDLRVYAAALDRRAPDGSPLVSPKARAALLEKARVNATSSRVLGAFSRLAPGAAQEEFLKNFREDFGKGEGPAGAFGLDEFRRLEGAMETDIGSARVGRDAAGREVRERIKSALKRAEDGFSPPPEEMTALAAAAATNPEAAAAFTQMEATLREMRSARSLSPAELDARIRARERDAAASGATAFAAEIIESERRLLTTMRTEIGRDPLGWAERSGLIPRVEPVSFADDVEATVTFRRRAAQAEAVAIKYGVEPSYLRPDERTALQAQMAKGGEDLMGAAAIVASSAGERAPLVMAELAKDGAPVLAAIGGHVATLGPTRAARDAANGAGLRKTDGFKSRLPGARDIVAAASTEALKTAFGLTPKAEASVVEMANLIYEARAATRGVTDFDADLWKQGLREALGERDIGGVTYGGIAENDASGWRSERRIVLPPNVRRDTWREVIDAITADDLAAAGVKAPVGADGKPIALSRIKQGALVQTGLGVYRVHLGDPDDPDDASWALAESGGYFTLDLNALEPRLKRRRPDLYLGGE